MRRIESRDSLKRGPPLSNVLCESCLWPRMPLILNSCPFPTIFLLCDVFLPVWNWMGMEYRVRASWLWPDVPLQGGVGGGGRA
jgi:hypothetical protein